MRAAAALLLLLASAPAAPQTDTAAAHARRRAAVRATLGADFALLLGQPLTDTLQPRQHGHFLYLTGVDEPKAALVLRGPEARAPAFLEGTGADALLLWDLPPRLQLFFAQRWPPTKTTGAALGFAHVRPAPRTDAALAERLHAWLPKGARLHVPAYQGLDDGLVRERRRAVLDRLQELRPRLEVHDLEPRLRGMRAVKDAAELARMRQALAVTRDAFQAALPAIRPGGTEAAVDGALIGAVRARGAQPAYRFVVGAGANGARPHHQRNDGPLVAGDLLVIDAGAEVHRYAADVTRTFPVSGTFTKRQRALYAIVLDAQRAALRLVRPGMTLLAIHNAALGVFEHHELERHALHGTSHHLGLDVHDPGPPRLEAGMVITVEPGIYLPDENLGIRIEDVVLVTDDGFEVLSAAFPKTPDEVEQWLRAAR